jgi:hypothetical protein
MIQPKRIQRKRTKGFNLQSYSKSLNGLECVVVSRPTKWGNPFKVGGYINAWGRSFVAIQKGKTPDGVRKVYKSGIFKKEITLKQSLDWYKMWLDFRIENKNLNIAELRGKNLACFCSLSCSCHADILLKRVSSVC